MQIRFPKLKRTRTRPRISVNICLIVHNNNLLHATKQNLVAHQEESLSTPKALAEAARRLLPNTNNQQKIALALPSQEFIATSLTLPAAITEQNVLNVVNLQLPTLLPGTNQPLLLAVKAQEKGGQTVALWMPTKRAEELFQAFNKVGLFLTCILPRPLVSLPKENKLFRICDEDEETLTHIEWAKSTVTKWLHLPKSDLEITEFHSQLETTLDTFSKPDQQISKQSTEDWDNLPMPPPTVYDYAFIPPQAAARMQRIAKNKQFRFIMAGVVLLVASISLGLGYAIHHKRELEKQLIELKNSTFDTRRFHEEISLIEADIAPIKNFPDPKILEVLATLNTVIPKNSWVNGFEIDGSSVSIQGQGPNPTELLQTLSDPAINQGLFAGVNFSAATEKGKEGKEKFSIQFQIKGIDMKSYWLEYFEKKE